MVAPWRDQSESSPCFSDAWSARKLRTSSRNAASSDESSKSTVDDCRARSSFSSHAPRHRWNGRPHCVSGLSDPGPTPTVAGQREFQERAGRVAHPRSGGIATREPVCVPPRDGRSAASCDLRWRVSRWVCFTRPWTCSPRSVLTCAGGSLSHPIVRLSSKRITRSTASVMASCGQASTSGSRDGDQHSPWTGRRRGRC